MPMFLGLRRHGGGVVSVWHGRSITNFDQYLSRNYGWLEVVLGKPPKVKLC